MGIRRGGDFHSATDFSAMAAGIADNYCVHAYSGGIEHIGDDAGWKTCATTTAWCS
jgi:hypothetical protein